VPDQETDRGATPTKSADIRTVQKREVQSAMKVAMKSAMQPLKRSSMQTSKRPVIEPESPAEKEPEPEEKTAARKHPAVHEKHGEPPVQEEVPQFCHNCGKKLPLAANFCPGCGTKLSLFRTLPRAKPPEAPAEKKVPPPQTSVHEKKVPPKKETGEDKKEDETLYRANLRQEDLKAQMTILHKFLRR
jgi:hypothetical protein